MGKDGRQCQDHQQASLHVDIGISLGKVLWCFANLEIKKGHGFLEVLCQVKVKVMALGWSGNEGQISVIHQKVYIVSGIFQKHNHLNSIAGTHTLVIKCFCYSSAAIILMYCWISWAADLMSWLIVWDHLNVAAGSLQM